MWAKMKKKCFKIFKERILPKCKVLIFFFYFFLTCIPIKVQRLKDLPRMTKQG